MGTRQIVRWQLSSPRTKAGRGSHCCGVVGTRSEVSWIGIVCFLGTAKSLANPPQDAINVAPKLIVCAVVRNNDTNRIHSFAVPLKRQRRPPRGKTEIVGIFPRITFTVGVYA